jgi:hypothetical protein
VPPRRSNSTGSATDDSVSIRHVIVTVRDDVSPQVIVTNAPPEGWQGQVVTPVIFTATDNVGVAAFAAFVDGASFAALERGCYTATTNSALMPCLDGAPLFSAALDPSKLKHGAHVVSLRASDASGNVSERSYQILVDHNPPAAPRALSLPGGPTWRADNRFEATWTNPPDSGESAVIQADYQLCPSANPPYDESGCVSGRVTGGNLTRLRDLEVPATDSGGCGSRCATPPATGTPTGPRPSTGSSWTRVVPTRRSFRSTLPTRPGSG